MTKVERGWHPRYALAQEDDRPCLELGGAQWKTPSQRCAWGRRSKTCVGWNLYVLKQTWSGGYGGKSYGGWGLVFGHVVDSDVIKSILKLYIYIYFIYLYLVQVPSAGFSYWLSGGWQPRLLRGWFGRRSWWGQCHSWPCWWYNWGHESWRYHSKKFCLFQVSHTHVRNYFRKTPCARLDRRIFFVVHMKTEVGLSIAPAKYIADFDVSSIHSSYWPEDWQLRWCPGAGVSEAGTHEI